MKGTELLQKTYVLRMLLSLPWTDKELFVFQQDVKHISSRTKQHEVWLIIMRLLSVLMSRTKTNSKSGSEVKIDFEKCYSSCGEIFAHCYPLCIELYLIMSFCIIPQGLFAGV